MKPPKQLQFTKALLAVYLIVLVWIILFKMQTDLSFLASGGYRRINWIPFYASAITNGKVDLSEIVLNILIFVPFGVYTSILKTEWGFLKKAAPAFFTSLAFEILQFIFGIGASDITDLLGNTLGGMAGILLFLLLSKLFKGNTIKLINILAAIGTVLMVGLITLLIVAN